ncbi:MAG: ATP-dependent RecD-like DNA helicase [Lachnospiraceae bacterium]|nr:ATP-dependent RecD-like DNA helicase [Lachnospiraceae bacterium]
MVIKGCVEKITYRSPDTGFTVLELNVRGEKDNTTCVGIVPHVNEGEYLEIEGEKTRHPAYGDQISIKTCHVTEPEDASAMEIYLGSGAIKGIGKALAARIVKAFGDDTFNVIETEPEKLISIKGISERIARLIAEQFEELKEQRRSMMFLQQYGISSNLAIKIYKQFGPDMYDLIETNPYKLAEVISGVGFKTADEIASRVGISMNSEYRIRAGIAYVLGEGSANGHTCLPEEILMRNASQILGVSEDEISRQLDRLLIEKKVILSLTGEGEKRIYTSVFYFMELNCARMLNDLNVTYRINESRLETRIEEIEQDMDMEFDELQKKAVREAAKSGILVLTGGPGTGKTTTINAIIRYFENEGMDILLAAPTGRAAKRIYETTGHQASTIHRLLELRPAGDGDDGINAGKYSFERNDENPLEADVVIIDEMSMVDISLMNALLKAICMGTRLIMVGDVNQLPSVGPGSVLKDIIDSEIFSVIRLNTVFRQAALSDIIVNAHRINNGEYPILDNKSKDFFYLRKNDTNSVTVSMLSMIEKKLPGYIGAKAFDIQVLTPMRKGELGVERLNGILQEKLNPRAAGKHEKEFRNTVFREGDKVMQVKNNYQIEWEVRSSKGFFIDKGNGIFNGDCGIIVSINSFAEMMTIRFDDDRLVEYPFSMLDELELAYAVTIHKSQGSEYPAVILPLLMGPAMLFNRNLLYTAVTRARKCVLIIGSEETVRKMTDNTNENRRYSGFEERLREASGK